MTALQYPQDQPPALSLSAINSQYFIGGMDARIRDPRNTASRLEMAEFRGVQPYWTGETAKEDAIGYAKARAKFGHGEIRVLNPDGTVERVINFNHRQIHR